MLNSIRSINKRLGKEILREIHFSNPLGFLSGRGKRSRKVLKEKYLGSYLSGEDKRWQQAIDSYSTGKILVDLKVITSEQLKEALQRQKELQEAGKRKSLGVLLVVMGYTNSKTYLEALSHYFDMPVVSLWKFIPSPSLQNSVGRGYANNHKMVVLMDSETELKLALAEPNSLRLEELKKNFRRNKKVTFCLANPFEVESCLRRYSDPYSENFYR